MCRIGVDVEKGFVDPILSTGSSSSKSITPTSIIDMQDGVAYYVKDGIKSTHFVSGATAKTIIKSCNKATDAGFSLSCMVILGLGGKKYTKENAEDTAKVINAV